MNTTEEMPSYFVLLAKDNRTITSGWRREPYFREYASAAGFYTGDFVEQEFGELT